MPYRFDMHRRLEAVHNVRDPKTTRAGLRAEVHDPAWFLARQWQLGEHRGEDAASPTRVHISFTETPITHSTAGPEHNPRVTPPEAVIESEPGQWWTPGRRARVGQALRSAVPAVRRRDPGLILSGLAPPHDRLNGRVLDGLALFRARSDLGLPPEIFVAMGVPAVEPNDDWQPSELAYAASFRAGSTTLTIPRHDGGNVDWYSTTASGPIPIASATPNLKSAYPIRVSYPGSPNPRWWQIDDHRKDPGAVAPHRTRLASLLMTHLVSSHGDDWFTAPLVTSIGVVVSVNEVRVEDAMGLEITLGETSDWSLYRVSGLSPKELLVWPTVANPINSPIKLDEVLMGIDEDANLLWAIERRANGAELADPGPPTVPIPESSHVGQVVVTGKRKYRYLPSSTMPRFWYPYLLSDAGGIRRFVQGRLADLITRPVRPLPGPTSRLLLNPKAAPVDPFHELSPAAIPNRGLRLERRYVLGRRIDGQPVLWAQRSQSPLNGPPVSGLRFDILEEVHDGESI